LQDLQLEIIEVVEADVRVIEDTVATMGALLQETLALSRIGRLVNPLEAVSFGDIVQGALKLLKEQITSSGAEVSIAEDFPTVCVDRMRIGEVLINLIENSVHYMGGDQTHPKIEIGYRLDGKETVFFVKDNGMGLDKSQHEKVFELLYRVDAHGEGTGAWLAIVKRIVEVHGGRIWV
jgi:light-regulated signal transduction histidine kinase (bacteriophytochrome)